MAKCAVEMPEEFLQKISKLGSKTDEIVSEVLKAGGEIVLEKVKKNLSDVVGKAEDSRSTGELEASLGLSTVKQDRDGKSNIKIGFSEPRSDGDSNAKIANILEYGRQGQPARPFLKPAKTASKNACIEAMKVKLTNEVDKL
ncbi:MAG: HK97 gp10 family phage protein [Clostridia bacterium]|nr:HK97 gp10 family phage protein [Clostridia bacterium]